MKAGVYIIEHKGSGKIYVGSSCDVARRLRAHLSMLRHGKHFSAHLQAAWDKHGAEAFEMRRIDTCVEADLIVVEQRWIDHYQAADPECGYNKSASSASRRGVPQPAAAAKRIGDAHRGKKRSPEWCARISAAAKARYIDPDKRAAASARTTAYFANPAARVRASASAIRRYENPDERAKTSVASRAGYAAKGKKVLSPEHRAKIGKSNRARRLLVNQTNP